MSTKTLYPEIKTANVAVADLNEGMVTIEPTVDATTGVKSLAYKDADGNVRRVLTTDSAIAGSGDLQDAYDNGNTIDLGDESLTFVNGTDSIKYDTLGYSDIIAETHIVHEHTIEADTDINLTAGGDINLKDQHLTNAVTLSESGETALATTSQSLVGAVNEVKESISGDTGYAKTADPFELYIVDGLIKTINMLFDGAMEKTGTDDWLAIDGADLTKETGTRTGGTGAKVLRCTDNSSNSFASAQQTILTIGNDYQLCGWVRSDGTSTPKVYNLGTVIISGTSSAVWQYLDVTFTAADTRLKLTSTGSLLGYAEFDDVVVKEV